ncbi:MerR family transcriptional regulator [Corynebacterium lubricantis]|uniref:MerR family transcriptional regulator n=1 Tax=Corynebacterium lubricantis TaxID=541095 RepID=UPI000370AABE|nr:MerR family transcriptional regulator [Corynebacterium lubricantis]
MKVKELADLTGTTVRAIRHYHHVGLVPVPDNPGVRRYGLDHAVRVVRIRALAESGLSLHAIGEILLAEDADTETQLAAAEADIDRRIAELQKQRTQLRAVRDRMEGPQFHVKHSALLDDFYARVLERVDPAQVPLIERERRAAEVVCRIPGVRDVLNRWLAQLTEERLEATLDLYAWFGSITELEPSEAEQAVDDALLRYDQAMEGDWGLLPEEWSITLPRVMRIPGLMLLLESAYPNPNHQLFIRRFLTYVDTAIAPNVSQETTEGELSWKP